MGASTVAHEWMIDAVRAQPGQEVDAVHIGSTNELHAAQAIAAAAAGKQVPCEKPLAPTLADARAIIEACARAGVVLATKHHLHSAATHGAMRKLVRAGALGQPLFAQVFHAVRLPAHLQGRCVNPASAWAGMILDITVDDANTLRFLLDAELVEAVEAVAMAARWPCCASTTACSRHCTTRSACRMPASASRSTAASVP